MNKIIGALLLALPITAILFLIIKILSIRYGIKNTIIDLIFAIILSACVIGGMYLLSV